MSQRVRNTKFQPRREDLPESSPKSRTSLIIEDKMSRFGRDAALHFDGEAWSALLAEQRQLIASAAGVDPAKVKIYVGH